MTAVLGIATLLGALWLEHWIPVTLPVPTGPFPVGRATYAWSDAAHSDLVWMWYPAAAGQSPALTEDYLPTPWRSAIEHHRGPLIGMLTRDLSKVHAHSLLNASVSPKQPSYPVVIMRGGASAEVINYTTLAEDLASYGYVAVGFDAPYRTSTVVFPAA